MSEAAEVFQEAIANGTPCVKCQRTIYAEDFNRQQVVATIGPDGVIACCVRHLANADGSKNEEEYGVTVRLMALAKAKALKQYEERAR